MRTFGAFTITPTRFLVLVVLVVASAGCGDDGGTTDSSAMDGGGDSGGDGGETDCATEPDGTTCAEGFICLGGDCSPSECGDNFLDTTAGEVCDDGNEIPGDGCEPSCEPTCSEASDCDDGDPCNGTETCNTSSSRCQAGGPGDGMMCMLDGGGDGVCSSGLCAPPGCGDSVVNGMEDCDDGMNGDNLDGCKDDCTFTCTMDADCDDADMCTGAEACDTATNTCTDPDDLDCDDADTCTSDSCEAATGCVNTLIDGDGDGYAVDTCTTGGLMGDDCDDSSSSVYPGAPELCDTIDNDCNGSVDDGTVTVTCLRDSDGDGYGNPDSTMDACTCPTGYIPPRADGRTDCQDRLVDVNQGQTMYFANDYCSDPIRVCLGGGDTYDYDCDGVEEPRWTSTSRSSCLSFDCRDGWTGSAVPACGASAQFRDCSSVILPSGLRDCIVSFLGTRVQECQ